MATGLIKKNSIIGLMPEVTEGTYLAPSTSAAYTQVLDGFDLKPKRETVDRKIIVASPGMASPRMGIKSAQASLPVEFRGSGTEGAAVNFDVLLQSALGTRRQCTSNVTTKTGNTSTVLQIQDADIAKFAVGDMVLVKQAATYEVRPILSKTSGTGTATITLAFALAGSPADNVVLGKFTTYYTAASGHPSISISAYWANVMRAALIGGKVSSMSLAGFETGKVADLAFTVEGINFTETAGAAPHTPVYDTGVPPLILNACIWRAGTQIAANALALTLKNVLGSISSTCSPNGRSAQRVKEREITGTVNPYMDDTSTGYFDDYVAGTEFSMFAYAYNPDPANAGQILGGSIVAIWLPQCVTLDFKIPEVDGILANELSFRASRGSDGSKEEMYLGLI